MFDIVFVEVRFPPTNSSYDFVVPVHLKISEITKLMGKLIEEKEHMDFTVGSQLLFDLERKTILPPGNTMIASGVIDGSRLMLV